MTQCEGCYYQDKKDNVCCHGNPFFDIDDNCTDYIENEFVKKIRADAIDECIAIERDEELEKTFYQMEDGLISAKEYEMRELKKEQNNGKTRFNG